MPSLQEVFTAFAKFGDTKATGKTITYSQIDKWFKQAKAYDKNLTATDTGIHFKKLKNRTINFSDFNSFLEDMAKAKKMDAGALKAKLAAGGLPGMAAGTTKTTADAAVARMTDTSKYTGTHKERFDSSGKGKGIEGRQDRHANDGYVQGYKQKDTYQTTH